MTDKHSCIALTAAYLSASASPQVQLWVWICLVLSHIPSDAIPHWHAYDFKKMKRTGEGKLGALIELGGGMILLPVVFCLLTGLNPVWAGACVFAANMFDFGVGFEQVTKINFGIDWLNHKLHWWDKREKETAEEREKSDEGIITWEIVQSVAIYAVMFYFAIVPKDLWLTW